jgi:hypothetical protein
MPVRCQRGHLRCVERKHGLPRWEFLGRETDASGRRLRRNAVIGTIEEYPTEDMAQAAISIGSVTSRV